MGGYGGAPSLQYGQPSAPPGKPGVGMSHTGLHHTFYGAMADFGPGFGAMGALADVQQQWQMYHNLMPPTVGASAPLAYMGAAGSMGAQRPGSALPPGGKLTSGRGRGKFPAHGAG
mmetsp:Transcript_10248/g.25807  ORF Transcript_10248/g.25807 Transcript_10248/m.25807 type:complete len:116 (+) Transcript_10248:3-350(+)